MTDELSNSSEKLYKETEKIKSLINLKTEELSASQILLLEKKQILENLSSNEKVEEDKQNSQSLNLQQPVIQEESTATLVEEGPKLVKTIKPLR